MSTRLTDDEYRGHRAVADGTNSIVERDHADDVLAADHEQAREDVKRLATELRNMAPFRWRGSGAYCWCPEARGAACFDKRGEPTGRGCITKNDLLREVEAVRQ